MLTTRYVVSMTRPSRAAVLLVFPVLALTLAGCASSGQSLDEACTIVETQWDKLTEMTEAMESPDDADWVKDTWSDIAEGLRTIHTGEELVDKAAASAAEHASAMPQLVDDTVNGVEGVSDEWASTVTDFGTEIAKISAKCKTGL